MASAYPKHNYALIVLDSCRYDSMANCWSELTAIPVLGGLERAFTLSTWTLTSHMSFMLGRLPWRNEPGHKGNRSHLDDLRAWSSRLGVDHVPFRDDYDFRAVLSSLGFTTTAVVSANPLAPEGPFRHCVENLISVGKHGATIERITAALRAGKDFLSKGRHFLLLNACETHYPYFDGTSESPLKDHYLPGFRRQLHAAVNGEVATLPVFGDGFQQILRERQQAALRYADTQLPSLFAALPARTFITVTSDHGDCFGEGNYWGHGEVADGKVLEVPFVEGVLPD